MARKVEASSGRLHAGWSRVRVCGGQSCLWLGQALQTRGHGEASGPFGALRPLVPPRSLHTGVCVGSGFSAPGHICEPASQSCVRPVGEETRPPGDLTVLQRQHAAPLAALVPGRLHHPCAGPTVGPSPGPPLLPAGKPSCSVSLCLDIKGRSGSSLLAEVIVSAGVLGHCVASGNLFRAYLQSDVWTRAVSSVLPERMPPPGGASSVGPRPES